MTVSISEQTAAIQGAVFALLRGIRQQDNAEVIEQMRGEIKALESAIATLQEYRTLKTALKAALAD